MKVKCPNCLGVFVPNKRDEKLIFEKCKKGHKFAMVECTNCLKDIPINPCDLLSILEIMSNCFHSGMVLFLA
jgi:hypothetical protein